MRRNRQRGFTMIEVMVVLAVVAILATMAVSYMKPKVKAIDTANRVGDLIREGSRRAVALGPVRANVALALGSKARTKIIASGTTQPTFTLQRLQEDTPASATTATWVDVQSYTVDADVIGDSYGPGTGSYASLTRSSTWSAFSSKCYPDGTCEAVTLFFKATTEATSEEMYARLSLMPLGGAIMTRKDWL